MKRWLLLVLTTVGLASISWAQPADLWRVMLHREALLEPVPTGTYHASSWARNNGNNDLGNYLWTTPDGWRVLADVHGAGMFTGIFFTRRSFADTVRLRIFIDDTVHALIDAPITTLIGQTPPFAPPLADTGSCAWYCYVPLPFQSHGRITYRGPALYYHVDARTLPAGQTIEPMAWPPTTDYLARLDTMRLRYEQPQQPWWPERPVQPVTGTANLAVGETRELLHVIGSHVSRRLLLTLSNHSQATHEQVFVRAWTDHSLYPDFEGPVATLFGAARGWYPYQSSVTGMLGDTMYLNLPVRFSQDLRVEVENASAAPVYCSVQAEIMDPPPGIGPLRLRGIYREANPTGPWQGFEYADLRGSGHFLGVVLDMQQREMRVVEGDETIYLEGVTEPVWRGTGTEDYFRGGYAWCGGNFLTQNPDHGCIYYQDTQGAAAYRWHLTDPVHFDRQFRLYTQVGGVNEHSGHYRSISFFYIERERWQLLDADRDEATCPGESLLVRGRFLPPGTTLLGLELDGLPVDFMPAAPVAQDDSTLTFTCLPASLTEGAFALVAYLSTGADTVHPAWPSRTGPILSFIAQRPDLDSCAFITDTLNVDLRGLPPYTPATVYAGGQPLPWVGMAPFSDDAGHLTGGVQVPVGLAVGDYALWATAPGAEPATSSQRLKVRDFLRAEFEALPLVQTQVAYRQYRFAPDFAPANSSDPWGRGMVWYMDANGVGSFARYQIFLPVAGEYRASYFTGQSDGCVRLRISIDGVADVDTAEGYRVPPWPGQWLRSDTIRGRTRELAAGIHEMRFDVIGRHPSANAWKMIFDQVVFHRIPAGEVTPAAVEQLTAQIVADGLELRWNAVRTDTAGQPLPNVTYVVYRTSGPDSAFVELSTVAGDTTFTDPIVEGTQGRMFYWVRARSGAGGARPTPPSVEIPPGPALPRETRVATH